MAAGQSITLRITLEDPIPGVTYSLQDAKSAPVGPMVATDAPLSFDVPVRVEPGRRFLGPFVRREGPARRFVYVASGEQAGDRASPFSRRVKLDIHDLPESLLQKALAGHILQARLPGRAKDGGPSCATLKPVGGWRIVA